MRISDDDEDPLSSAVLSKGPCPKCGSDDNLVTYQDGHQHCFTPGCDYHVSAKGTSKHMPKATPQAATLREVDGEKFITGTALPLTRGLKPATLTRFEYQGSRFNNKPVHVWPIYDQQGNLAHQRLRFTDKKDFVVLKGEDADPIHTCQPFGKTVWGDANDKRVVVTEGEIDAMTVAQCSAFKFPVVSGHGGAGSTPKMLKANYKWFDRFDEIILWLDDDEAGRAELAECVSLFSVGKVKIAKIAGYKDANEALQVGKNAEIELAIYAAVTWRPKGVVNLRDRKGDILGKVAKPFWQWPFPTLQKHTKGILRGKVYYHVAGTGVGKSTILFETLVHLVMDDKAHTEEPAKIGLIAFETDIEELELDMLSILANRRLKLDEEADDDERSRLHDQLFGQGRFESFDPENAEWTFDGIISYINYMVKALDCNEIVIDPLSALAALLPGHVDERRALDQIGMTLARKAKELGVNIHVAHHLTRPSEGAGHEEGGKVALKQVRGSGGIANHADGVLGYERNQQHENPEAKFITIVRSLKWRFTGFTGIACYTKYDPASGRTTELPEQAALAILGGTGGHGSKAGPDSEFHEWEDDKEF